MASEKHMLSQERERAGSGASDVFEGKSKGLSTKNQEKLAAARPTGSIRENAVQRFKKAIQRCKNDVEDRQHNKGVAQRHRTSTGRRMVSDGSQGRRSHQIQ